MTRSLLGSLFLCLNIACEPGKMNTSPQNENPPPVTLVIHGGGSNHKKEKLTPEREIAYHQALKHALDTGYSVLTNGGKSLDAVIAAIKVLEDSPLFNAGKGAVFTYSGKNEL